MTKPQEFIARAQAAGSTATTLKGAGRYLISAARVSQQRFERQSRERIAYYPYRAENASATARAREGRKSHEGRLLSRYVGMKRLPKSLNQEDKRTIAASSEMRNYTKCLALPLCARAFFADSVRTAKRLKREIAQWDAAKGNLVSNGEVAHYAYRLADWGRLRKTYTGNSTLSPGIVTTDNGKWGWDKVVWHSADYTLINSRKRYGLAYFVGPDHVARKCLQSPHYYQINGERFSRTIRRAEVNSFPVHIQRRLLEAATPRALRVEFDREAKALMLIEISGENYHVGPIKSAAAARAAVKNAISAFRIRRATHVNLSDTTLEFVFVQLTDSTEAGNCESQSKRFAEQAFATIGAQGDCAVRADIILSLRNDSYTRRAVSFAATRNSQSLSAAA
jgi:hypothetical protein